MIDIFFYLVLFSSFQFGELQTLLLTDHSAQERGKKTFWLKNQKFKKETLWVENNNHLNSIFKEIRKHVLSCFESSHNKKNLHEFQNNL